MSGLVCARELLDHGLDAVLFDKGARPGGRLATRAVTEWDYDHGAQYFTARDPRFLAGVHSWIEAGLAAEWEGRLISIEGDVRKPTSGEIRRYVGVPKMRSIATHLAKDLDVRCRVTIRSVSRRDDRWYLAHGNEEEGPFDLLVVTVPAPQAVLLLDAAPAMQREVAGVRMNGCWAVLVAFSEALGVEFDGAFVNGGPLSWVARNGSKPGRRGETWVLHATPEWTREHLESDREPVGDALLEAFARLAQARLPEPVDRQVHLWRYAIPEVVLPSPCLFDGELAVAVCGDWCGGPKVEGAFLSGRAAAERIVDRAAGRS
jgi:predicted NAD/FAD-dependent oxidoreductase